MFRKTDLIWLQLLIFKGKAMILFWGFTGILWVVLSPFLAITLPFYIFSSSKDVVSYLVCILVYATGYPILAYFFAPYEANIPYYIYRLVLSNI